ncbi:integrase arm-type DNA-binding domain-containing protein [Pasteurellaceae bacterium TAE3-ERU1]|nr:integrase arm-type DNA-binding domain-containing protein [Pasteurellaceae bacterium TAE3-ERU1]
MGRKTAPLSLTQIRNAKPKNKDYILSDGNNLTLLIRPNGSKLWRFTYYHPVSKKRLKMSVGAFPVISLDEAREKALALKKLVANNIDPIEHRASQQAELLKNTETLASLALKWREWKRPQVMPNTMIKNWLRLEKNLFPVLGEEPVQALTMAKVINALKPLEAKSTDALRKVIGLLRELMVFAQMVGVIEANPLADLRKAFVIPPHKNQPSIAPDELPEFLFKLERADCIRVTKNLIMWQLLTMVRPSEAVAAE